MSEDVAAWLMVLTAGTESMAKAISLKLITTFTSMRGVILVPSGVSEKKLAPAQQSKHSVDPKASRERASKAGECAPTGRN